MTIYYLQVRWWKGRFQRKHRDEDLLQGCGRQLMHWQMKSSCCVKCKKISDKDAKKAHRSAICQHFMSSATSVIQTVSTANQPAQNPLDESLNVTVVLDDIQPSKKNQKPVSSKKQQPGDSKAASSHDDDDDDDDEGAPDWLFERARDLQYRMHKTDWMYKRAKERDYHRKRPDDWYHARAQAREKKHHCIEL